MYSEVVDTVVTRTARPGRINDIKSYVNGAIRECQCIDYTLFTEDFIEDQIVASASPHIFTNPANFRIMRTVYYPASGIYPEFLMPGKKQRDKTYFYYQGPGYHVFKGIGIGDNIDIGYYAFAPALTYYAVGARPAVAPGEKTSATTTNDTGAYVYLSGGSYVATLGSTAADDAAKALTTNWLLDDWRHVIEEGAIAKVYNIIGDERAPKSFALYKSYQEDVKNGVGGESLRQ